MTRASGISPLLVFFDATGTTDSAVTGNTSTFQNVHYSWSFGDSGPSGTGTWGYGSNPGNNSTNSATGGVAAHLYRTQGTDTDYTATVTAYDGTNTASCQLGVVAYDPSGADGFAGTKTTCVASSSTPTAGSGGCPAGAQVLRTSSISTATGASYIGSGKRVLFKCGDTFSGSSVVFTGVKWSLGAYGGCEDTTSNRPIFTGPLQISNTNTGDGRVADLDFESCCTNSVATVGMYQDHTHVNYYVTIYNVLSHGNNASFYWAQCHGCALVNDVQTGMGAMQGTFLNESGNESWSGNTYNDMMYLAVIGSSFSGAGAPNGNGIETVRIPECDHCYITNNVFENGNSIGAALKFHNGQPGAFAGSYTQYTEMSDNLFQGTSGAQLVEIAPTDNVKDERIRYIVVERNVFQGSSTGSGRQVLVSAENVTLRDNAFNQTIGGGGDGADICERGSIAAWPTQYIQAYNNSCYGGTCVSFANDGACSGGTGNNSVAKNNLCYTGSCVSGGGSGNTVSNNSSTTSTNPNWTNASGTFGVITDWKPTANYSGGTSVPVWYDALGVPWTPTWDLGAVHH